MDPLRLERMYNYSTPPAYGPRGSSNQNPPNSYRPPAFGIPNHPQRNGGPPPKHLQQDVPIGQQLVWVADEGGESRAYGPRGSSNRTPYRPPAFGIRGHPQRNGGPPPKCLQQDLPYGQQPGHY